MKKNLKARLSVAMSLAMVVTALPVFNFSLKNGNVYAAETVSSTTDTVSTTTDAVSTTTDPVSTTTPSSSSTDESGSTSSGGGSSSTDTTKTPDKTSPQDEVQTTSQDGVQQEVKFEDVQASAWYSKSVEYVVKNNLMLGVSNKNFAPNQNTTRGMIVTILHRLSKDTSANTAKFSDVQNDKWYANAVAWASQNSIVSGYDSNTFKPNQDVSREQLVVILYNYTKFKGKNVSTTSTLDKFSDDSNVSKYAQEAMKWAVENGIIVGINGKLEPKGMTTRAQLATILQNYVEKFEK